MKKENLEKKRQEPIKKAELIANAISDYVDDLRSDKRTNKTKNTKGKR